MHSSRRGFINFVAGAATAGLMPMPARSETWPARPIHAFVPAGAGSAVDIIPRIVFDQLASQLGQPIVVENRVGAGGTIAIGGVAKADPDGYTILANSSQHTIAPWLYPGQAFDVVNDLTGVIALGTLPTVLVTSPDKGRRTIAEFVAAARAAPGTFNYTSTGVGAATHLSAERFRASAGIDAVHIPVKGGPEALTEVMSGRADFYFCPIGTALPFIRDQKVLALVVSSAARAPALADVPTTAEAGFVDADYVFWLGLFAPVKTPRTIIETIYAGTTKALNVASVHDRLASLGVDPMPMTSAEFDAYVRKEIAANEALVKSAHLR